MFYKIVEATTPEKLSSMVNGNIGAGFVPIGGICHGEGAYLYQSMISNDTAHQHSVSADSEGQCSCPHYYNSDYCGYFKDGQCEHPRCQ